MLDTEGTAGWGNRSLIETHTEKAMSTFWKAFLLSQKEGSYPDVIFTQKRPAAWFSIIGSAFC